MLFPERCFGCGRRGEYPCKTCYKKIVPLIRQYCPYCRVKSYYGRTCQLCIRRKPALDGVFVCAEFQKNGVLRAALHACKYKGKRRLIPLLCQILCTSEVIARFNSILPQDTMCVPVPLAAKRLRERGFNQALDIAVCIAEHTGRPCHARVLERIRYTAPQAKLSGQERRKNLDQAFTCKRAPPTNVLLIDDVATTLSTLETCAKTLRASGSQFVYGLVLARSGGDL